MKKIKTLILLLSICLFLTVPFSAAQSQQRQDNGVILVGRISYIEGQLLRYVPEDKDWVAAVTDAPFGMEDSLYTVANSRAEFIIPNNTWIRIDDKTQIQVLDLENDATQADVASGVARFYNRSAQGVIKATTPFGYVIAPAYTAFDLYVGNESVEVIALKGTVDFIHGAGNTKYAVTAGSFSILADSKRVASGKGAALPVWDAWNATRDDVWKRRLAVTGDSGKYLPSGIRDEAYVLEENGSWERIYYDGAYRNFWRPRYVYDGWAPYTVGRWTVWYGDNCWIPYEPFGYVTHHYGNWVYVDRYRCWYWAPPVTYAPVASGPFIVFSWYPGRVSWIYTDGYIGWVPLAPWEPYYCYHHWGPSSVVVNNINITNIYIDKHKHHYGKHAVVVKQDHFYSVNNYKEVRIKNIQKNVAFGMYQRIPVISDRVIKNFQGIKQRHNFTNTPVSYKPHHSAEERIKYNQAQARQAEKEPGSKMLKQIAKMQRGEIVSGTAVKNPEASSKLVPARRADSTRKPASFSHDQVTGWTISQPAPQEHPEMLTRKTPVPRMSSPGRESEPTEKGRNSVPEAVRPMPPQEGTIKIDQPEKPIKMKEGRRRPQPLQSAVLTQPDGHKQPAQTPAAASRPIPPRTEKKMTIEPPELPVKREEGRRITNQPHAVEPVQSGKRVDYHRNQPASKETMAPVPQRNMRNEQPGRTVQMGQQSALSKPSPHQSEQREIAPPQQAYSQPSTPSRQSKPGQYHYYQQGYASRQGFQPRQR